jgi:hypothetical protein
VAPVNIAGSTPFRRSDSDVILGGPLVQRGSRIRLALTPLALLLGPVLLLILWHANGYTGDKTDDFQYLIGAKKWLEQQPYVGVNHWQLRHTLVIPLAASFKLFGLSRAAMMVVPILYYLATFVLTFLMLSKRYGVRLAVIWTALFCTTPLFHLMGSEAFPDLIEVFWVAASFWAFVAAVDHPAIRNTALIAAGVAASLAMLTRETTYYVPVAYGLLFLVGKPLPRKDLLWVVVGALPLLLAEELWLGLSTGDWLYRQHIDMSHVLIPSAHMIGGIHKGSVLFSSSLASSWTVDGPVNVHWSINPLIYLFLSPEYGGIGWFLVIAGILGAAGRVHFASKDRRFVQVLFGLAALAFAFQTYVLMVSQRPRYYGFEIYCLTIACAMLIESFIVRGMWTRTLRWLWVLQVLAFVIITEATPPGSLRAATALPLLRGLHEPVYMDSDVAGHLGFPMEEIGASQWMRTGGAPIGGLELHIASGNPKKHKAAEERFALACCSEEVASHSSPRPVLFKLIAGVASLFGSHPIWANNPKYIASLHRRTLPVPLTQAIANGR